MYKAEFTVEGRFGQGDKDEYKVVNRTILFRIIAGRW